MASPTVTYTFTNGTVADATQMNTNFTDIINALTDGTKSISIDALTVAGAALFNGAVTLGNATGDDVTITGYVASAIVPKTTNTYALGSSSLLYSAVYSTLFLAGDGSAAAPAYSFNSSGNGDNGMYLSAANQVSFATAGSQRLVIDPSGDVGINCTPTGGSLLHVTGIDDNYVGRFTASTASGKSYGPIIYAGTTNADVAFNIRNSADTSQLFFIRGDGNIGIGLNTPSTKVYILDTAASTTTLFVEGQQTSNHVAYFYSNVATSGNVLKIVQDSATASGNALNVTTDGTGDAGVFITNNASAYGVLVGSGVAASQANNTKYMRFAGSSGGDDGYIQTNGSAVLSIVDVSDERIKKNVKDASYGLKEILALRPVEFQWKNSDNESIVKGFIAQEVKAVLPESVIIKRSGDIEDFHSLETQTMIPVLVKAIQELSSKLDTALSEIELLKAR